MSSGPSNNPSRKLPSLLVGVVLCLLALLAVASLGSYRDLAAAKDRQHFLEQRIEETRLRNERLRSRIERLRTDPSSLERVAREQYRMQRPGDVVIVIPEGAASVERRQ